MRFTIYRSSSDGLWYWRLRAGNHEVIAQGEGYTRRGGAEHAIELIRSASDAPLIELDEPQ
jgi:uncharacterized protein YegP (UPF0339 family)